MARKYFGTDGIRGRANGVITPELALKVDRRPASSSAAPATRTAYLVLARSTTADKFALASFN